MWIIQDYLVANLSKAVAITLALLLLINMWIHLDRNQLGAGGDIVRMRKNVQELAERIVGLTAKYENLQGDMCRVSARLSSYNSRASAQELAYSRLLLDSYDKHTRDFALESAGARILNVGSTQEHVFHESSMSRALYAVTSVLCPGCDGARTMLQPRSMPGECWAFKGSSGEAVILLLGRVKVTGFAIEHIPIEISPSGDRSSAPRRIRLEGLDDASSRRGHDFGEFEYDREGWQIQYFVVERPAERYFSMVRVLFLSNWGHPVYTCVYRVRVHGDLDPGPERIAPEKVGDGDAD